MPLYNNASTLKRAIDSIKAQTYTHWKIIISDDGSTDETTVILNSIDDPRIEIFHQPKNLYFKNFNFVLNNAKTPYFAWLAGDDYWNTDFLEKSIQYLRENKNCTLISPKCSFEDQNGTFQSISTGTYPVTGDINERIAKYLKSPSDNSRMYGLFRTEQLKKSMPHKIFHAWDWSLCARNLQYGEHHELDEVLIYREKTDSLNYVKSIERDEVSILTRYFPLMRCTSDIMSNGVTVSRTIIKSLIYINILKHWEYIKYKNHFLNKIMTPFYWRLLKLLSG
jgi:glycosyltransferase involved in cell wall biosynthesis